MKLFKNPLLPSQFKYAPFFKLKFVTILLIAQVFLVPFLQAGRDDANSSNAFKAWLLSGIILLPFVLGSIYGVRKIFYDLFKDEIPIILILISGFLIGFFKGFMTQYLVNLFHVGDPFPIDEMLIRGLSGGSLAVALGFSLSLKASLQGDYVAFLKRERENDEIAQEIGVLGNQIDTFRADSEGRIALRVLERIQGKIDFNIFSSDPERNWRQISLELRETVAAEVRAESYSLSQFRHTEVKARELWLQVLKTQTIHLNPLVFAVINLMAGLAIFYRDSDNWASFGQPILNFYLSFLVVYIFKRLQKTSYLSGHFRNHFLVFSVVATNVLVLLLLTNFFPLEYQVAPFILIILWQISLLYTISSAIELIQYKSERLKLLESIHEDLIDKRRILEQYHQRIRNDISTHLHGFLVSKLHNESLRLENFGEEQDFVNFDKALKLLLSEFTLEKFREGLKKDLIGPDFFKECKKSWDGIVCIEFLGEVDFPARLDETTKIELAQVVEEIIANANRHGGATEVSIDFSWLDEEHLEITARDNGRGVKSDYTKGLGCALYEVASDGEWRIEGAEGIGSTLYMRITRYERETRVEATSAERAASVQPVDQSR